jgi:hypothetical protein
MKEHNFGEKEKEYFNGKEMEVWQSPKYKASRDKAIEMIESNRYDLTDADFWILMNSTKTGKMAYTGLIISHNGCLKINDKLDNKVKPSCFSLDKDGYNNSLVYTYCDEDTFEVGEFNSTNGKNAYPYAMAFKRCFDRVVLKKSKLAFSGIYSEVEADEFKEQPSEETTEDYKQQVEDFIITHNLDKKEVCTQYKLTGKSTQNEFEEALTQLKVEQKNAS